ncbi:MAG: hypothetical protein ABIK73_06615 [candidate division WOR-3 bacterium]
MVLVDKENLSLSGLKVQQIKREISDSEIWDWAMSDELEAFLSDEQVVRALNRKMWDIFRTTTRKYVYHPQDFVVLASLDKMGRVRFYHVKIEELTPEWE